MRTIASGSGQLNRLTTLWSENRATLGVIITIPSVHVVQILSRAGLDWIFARSLPVVSTFLHAR
jgi:hypothetical protein